MRVRPPRVRFKLWWLMVAVATVAVALGVEGLRRRSVRFRELADEYALRQEWSSKFARSAADSARTAGYRAEASRARAARQQARARSTSEEVRMLSDQIRELESELARATEEFASTSAVYARQIREKAAWYLSLRRKYEHAARFPWLPVEPDPPEPD